VLTTEKMAVFAPIAERQGGDGDHAESGGLNQQADRVAEVGDEAAHVCWYEGERTEVQGEVGGIKGKLLFCRLHSADRREAKW